MESPLTLGSRTPEEHEERQAALDRGVPFLLFRDGDGRQRIFNLDAPTESITVGRRYEADISLPWDPEASRLHAELAYKAGEWTICDDGWSQNGTWVNGLRLAGRRRLADGDLVKIGRTIMGFHRPGPKRTRTDDGGGRALRHPALLRAAAAHPARALPAAVRRRRRLQPVQRPRGRRGD